MSRKDRKESPDELLAAHKAETAVIESDEWEVDDTPVSGRAAWDQSDGTGLTLEQEAEVYATLATGQERVCEECDKVFDTGVMVEVSGDWYCQEHAGPYIAMQQAREKAKAIKLNDEQSEALALSAMQKLKESTKTSSFYVVQIVEAAETDEDTIRRGLALCEIHGTVHRYTDDHFMLKPNVRKVRGKRKEAEEAVGGQLTTTGKVEVVTAKKRKTSLDDISSDDEKVYTLEESMALINAIKKNTDKLKKEIANLYIHKAWISMDLPSFAALMAKHFPDWSVRTIEREVKTTRVVGILNAATLTSQVGVRSAALLDRLTPEKMVEVYEKADDMAHEERDQKEAHLPKDKRKAWKVKDSHISAAYALLVKPEEQKTLSGPAPTVQTIDILPTDNEASRVEVMADAAVVQQGYPAGRGILVEVKPIDFEKVEVWVKAPDGWTGPNGEDKFYVVLPLAFIPAPIPSRGESATKSSPMAEAEWHWDSVEAALDEQ